jgi:Ca-activated chloride channel homolog
MKKFIILFAVCCSAYIIGAFAKSPAPKESDCVILRTYPEQRKYFCKPGQEVVFKIELCCPNDLKAPRLPLNLALVIDRSGSMSGSKIEKARESAIQIVDQLQKDDTFSLIAYDNEVQVLVPSQPVEDKNHLKRCISRLEPGGSTALYAGVQEGAEQLEKYLTRKRVNRVILLSDGLANVGPSSPRELSRLGMELARNGISVSTLGIGDDYNEDLMAALAEASDANYYYVKDVEELPKILAKELGILTRVAAREIRVEVTCPDGVEPIGFIGRTETFKQGVAQIDMGPIVSGQTRYLFLRCMVENPKKLSKSEIAKVNLDYADEINGGQRRTAAQVVKVEFSDDTDEVVRSVDKDVRIEKELVLNAEQKSQAIGAADKGDYKAAASVIKSQISRLSSASYDAPAEKKQELQVEIQSLSERAKELEDGKMDKGSRKAMQSESYKTRNSK